MAPRIERVKVALIEPLVDEYGNEFLSRDYSLQVNKDYVTELAESFGPSGEPDEHVKLVRDGDVFRIKAGNSRVRAMKQLGTEECWAVIDDDDTVQGVVETAVRTNVKKKYEPVEESRFTQQLAMFGDDEYVGGVSGIGAEKAARLRRGRAMAGEKAEQMSLDRLYVLPDFEGRPEMVEQIIDSNEGSWRGVADRLRREKEREETREAFAAKAVELNIGLVEDRPSDKRWVMTCDGPDDLAADYMSASVTHKGLVGRIADNWSGVCLDLYGVPLHDEEEDEAEAEQRRLREEYSKAAALVDGEIFEWVVDQFDVTYDATVPAAFQALLEHCYKLAKGELIVQRALEMFPQADSEDECLTMFAIGYSAGVKRFAAYADRIACEPRAYDGYYINHCTSALAWADLHIDDGWQPSEGAAAFLGKVREWVSKAKALRDDDE